MIDLDQFRLWLGTRKGRKGQNLSSTTIDVYVQGAAAIDREGAEVRRYGSLLGAAHQLLLWEGTPRSLVPLLESLRASGPATHGRHKPARSVPEKTWARFTEKLDEEAPRSIEAAVLKVLADTGLRIGDVLRIPLAELRAGYRSGRMDLSTKGNKERIVHWDGAESAWVSLLEHSKKSSEKDVAGLVSSGSSPNAGSAAYKAVSRAMAAIGNEIDSSERWHLHRMRRTVLVRALEETGDLALVQQLGGHENINTTVRYLDEVRAKETAELQRKLTKKRGG